MTRIALLVFMVATAAPIRAQTVCTNPQTLDETLRVGSTSGDVTLSWVRDLEVGQDGTIYLAEEFLREVTRLSSNGDRLPSLGRPGSGPGDFSAAPTRIGWKADSLWVSDRFETQFFLPDGTASRSVEFRTPFPDEMSAFIPGTPLSDGTFLPARLVTGEPAPFFAAREVPLLRFSSDGELVDTLLIVEQPLAEFTVRHGMPGDDDYLHTKHPLASWDAESWLPAAVTQDGSAVVVIGAPEGSSTQRSFELLVVGVSGDTLLARTVSYEPRRITASQKEALQDAVAAWATGEYFPDARARPSNPQRVARLRQAARRSLVFPIYHPPVREIVTGVDGSIWLLRQAWPSDTDVWESYDRSGQLLGSVEIASGRSHAIPWFPRLRVLRTSRIELWGMTLGEFDEPYLHRFRIVSECSERR